MNKMDYKYLSVNNGVYKTQLNADNWYTNGRDPQRTYYAPVNISADLQIKYNPIVTGAIPWAIVNNVLYTANRNELPTLYAVDLGSNTVRWKFTSEGNAELRYVMANDNAIFIAMGYKIYSLRDMGDRYEINWTKSIGPGAVRSMAFDDKNLYYIYVDISTPNHRVNAVDINTGADRWSYALNKFDTPPDVLTAGGGKVFFVIPDNRVTSETNMFALDAATSEVMWTAPLYPARAPSTGSPVYSDGKVFIDMESSTPPQTITAYDANDGSTLWQYKLSNTFGIDYSKRGVFSVNDASVISIDTPGNLFALDKETGRVRWHVLAADQVDRGGTLYSVSTNMPIILSKDKIFIENNGKIKIFDAGTGNQISVITPNPKMASLEIASKMLITTDANNKLYAFSEKAPEALQNYTVAAGDTLGKIARQFGTTPEHLAQLNNIANIGLINVGQIIKVPVPPAPAPLIVNYTIKKGDILSAISARYKVPLSDIISFNNITDPNKIYIGETLKIPIKNYTVYTVGPGDTLWAIARKYNTSVDLLTEINKLVSPNSLMIGQKLYII